MKKFAQLYRLYILTTVLNKKAGFKDKLNSWVLLPVTSTVKGIAADPGEFIGNVLKGSKAVYRNIPQFFNRSILGGVDGILSTPAMLYSYGVGAYNKLKNGGLFKTAPVWEWSAAPMQYMRNKLDKAYPSLGINKAFTIDTGDKAVDDMLDFTAHSIVGGGLSGVGTSKGVKALSALKAFNRSAKAAKAVRVGGNVVGGVTAVPSLPANYVDLTAGSALKLKKAVKLKNALKVK